MIEKQKGMTAQKLRLLLLALLVLILAAGVAGFLYTQKQIKGFAAETNTLNQQADNSDRNLEALKQTEQYLATHKDAEKLAQKVVSESKSYQYQNDIIGDLTSLARASGITITQFDFASTTDGQGASGSSTPSTPNSSVPNTTTQPKSGLKSVTANITVKSPVSYDKMLKFMKRIEQNTTKMQIANVSLAKGDKSGVSVSGLSIEVYVK